MVIECCSLSVCYIEIELTSKCFMAHSYFENAILKPKFLFQNDECE